MVRGGVGRQFPQKPKLIHFNLTSPCTVIPRFTDNRLIRPGHLINTRGQFALSLGKENPYTFLNLTRLIYGYPFNADTYCGPNSVHVNVVLFVLQCI